MTKLGRSMTTLLAEFTVVGKPVPQGSTRAFAIRKGKGKAAPIVGVGTTNDPSGELEKWRGDIRSAVPTPRPPGLPSSAAISMRLAFRLPRPKDHYLPVNSKRSTPELRPGMPAWWPGGKDLDKLIRAVLDALTNVLYRDDSQVVVIGATKALVNPGEQPGVDVRVSAL